MTNTFVCRDTAGRVLANWVIGPDGSEFTLTTRCELLRLQQSEIGRIPNNGPNTGDTSMLVGNWTEIAQKVLPTTQSALENSPVVVADPLQDQYAHQAIRTSTAERFDAVHSRLSQLNTDDRTKFEERMLRDASRVIRALEGDIFTLQKLLGGAMRRLDALENWSISRSGVPLPALSNSYTDPNDQPRIPFPPIPEGRSYWDLGIDAPVNPGSFHNNLVPHEHATNITDDFHYHQGYHSEHALKRFWNAARAIGIDEPDIINPLSHETFSAKRYNQGV